MNLFELAAVISLDSSGFMGGLKDASAAAQSIGGKIGSAIETAGKVATAAFGAATAAAVAFGADAVGVGQSFDKSMSQVAATMGYSVEQLNTDGSEAAETFKQLRDFAQDMGAKTAFSASQAADALNYMALAGYEADASMKMLPNVLNLAAAGGMELAAASDMITDSQSALGLTLEETAELVDKMAKASSKSNTSVSQLGSAILTVGGTAKAIKGGTTELAQVLGIIADNGVKGAEGGTALRNIILSLTAPTDKAAATLERLGVSALDSSGDMRSMKDIFADLNNGLANLTEGQKTAVLSEIFNKVDLKSVNALMNTNVSRWDELSEAIDNASGAAEAMANTQLDNLAGDLTIFQSALEGVKIAVSDEITPALREFVQLGTKGLSDLGAAIKENGLAGAMDALAPFIDNAIGVLMEGIPKAVAFGGQLLGAITSGIVNNLPRLAEGAVQVVSELGGQLIAAAPEIVEKGGELLNFIADGILNNIDSMVDVALNLIDSFAGFLGEAIPAIARKGTEIIVTLANALSDPKALENLAQSALTIITAFAGALIMNAPRIGYAALDFLQSFSGMIIDHVDELADVALNVIDTFAGFLADAIPRLAETAANMIITLALTLSDPSVLSNLAQSAIAIISGIATAIVNNLPRLAETAWQVIANFASFIEQNLPGVLDAGFRMLNELTRGIMSKLPDFIARLPEIIRGFMGVITDNLPIVLSGGVSIIESLTDGILNAIPSMMDAIFEIIPLFVDFLTDNFPVILDKAVELAGILVDAVIGAADEIGNKLAEKIPALSLLFENLETVVMAAVGAFVAYKAAMAITGLINGVSKAITGAKAAFAALNAVVAANPFVLVATLIAGLVAALITLWNTNEDFRNAVKGIWEAITKFFTDAWEAITGVWSAAAEWFAGIRDGIFEAFANIGKWFGDKFTAAYNAVTGAWNGAGKWFGDRWADISGAFQSAEKWFSDTFSKAWKGVKDAFGGVKDFFGGVWDDITGVFTGAFDWFKGIGENIINGITEGIGGLWSTFINFLSGKTDEVKEEFEGEQGFDTHSPSKWSEKVFRNVLQGGEVGLERGLPGILSGAKDAVRDIQGALSADPFRVSGGYQLSGGYSYAQAPQLAAAGAGYGASAGGAQPLTLVLNNVNEVGGERYERRQRKFRVAEDARVGRSYANL